MTYSNGNMGNIRENTYKVFSYIHMLKNVDNNLGKKKNFYCFPSHCIDKEEQITDKEVIFFLYAFPWVREKPT